MIHIRNRVLNRQVSPGIVELASSSSRTRVKLAGVHYNPALHIQLDLCPIHRPRRRAFKVDTFGVIPASVTRTFEFILAGLPIRSAAEVGASRIYDKDPGSASHHPDPVLFLELCVDAQSEIGQRPDGELRFGFEKHARKKEPQKHQEIGSEKRADARPDKPSSFAKGFIMRLRRLA